jgi:hypothetical protein
MKHGDLARTIRGCLAFYDKISQQNIVEHNEILLILSDRTETLFQNHLNLDFIKVLRNNGSVGFVRIDSIQPIQ